MPTRGLTLAMLLCCGGLVEVARPVAAGGAADPRIEVKFSPVYSLEPGRVTITVRHRPDPGDRQMTVEAESDAFFRSSTFPLDGDAARQLHDITLKGLPAGEYRVRVSIEGADPGRNDSGGLFRVCHSQETVGYDGCSLPARIR